MWQELLGAREEIVNQIGKSLHEWSKIVLLVKKKKKVIYAQTLSRRERNELATRVVSVETSWRQGHGWEGNLKYYACWILTYGCVISKLLILFFNTE